MAISIGITNDAVLEMSGRRIPVKVCNIERRHLEPTRISVLANLNPNADIIFNYKNSSVDIDRVIFNCPVTVVIWKDGTKTVVKCQPGDVYSKETGLALCIAKKYFGNKSNFNNVFKKYIVDEF